MFLHQEQTHLANRLKLSTSTTSQSSNNTNNHYHQHQLPQLDAVIIRNLTYEAGRGRGKRVILNKINLTVPEGSIYGLLGPSGCGKTTMLRCIVGRIRARSGSVLVFGLSPGAGQGEVPGKDVGYMPQEISIYEDFTIEETLFYFGKINRMPESDIKKRVEFLLQFLDLPSRKRLVVNLSGGQKRRVSLAAALVHSPPLLILDEPTVGVDPLLRQSIWEHLVSLTQTERISVIITTHYIEEARQANVVGLMRHGKILAEDSPEDLMRLHQLTNLEDVFLKLCVTDSSRRAAQLATSKSGLKQTKFSASRDDHNDAAKRNSGRRMNQDDGANHYEHRWDALATAENRTKASGGTNTNTKLTKLDSNLFTRTTVKGISDSSHESSTSSGGSKTQIRIHTGTNKVELIDINGSGGHVNEAVEVFSSDDDISSESSREPIKSDNPTQRRQLRHSQHDSRDTEQVNYRNLIERAAHLNNTSNKSSDTNAGDYLAMQAMKWATRRTTELNLMSFRLDRGYHKSDISNVSRHQNAGGFRQWCTTLMAVTWKNYIRLRRNPPVLVFQFMLPAIQVILFCLCIGGDPFDVPVAIVNDEVVPRSSLQFLNGLNKKIIRQVKYDNLTSAMEAVRRGSVWGAIHIPDKYSQNLQTRLIMGEEVTNETISNGTIRVYPDLTNLHLALALETTFRETFIDFARDSLEELGYDRSLADLPIQIGKPVYGNMKKDGYLEFMAPGVVISISYVMATGLTALAFILERRDGLLERSLVSGVQTGQILLAHAINQVVVMVIQIFLVLGCTFFVFEIPSRGPFFWVVLLILLQGCTGMGFGLLVSAVCEAENTAVMMVVGTFYTNLILAGIIWPIEAMPHWLRPLSYAQPQTLPTDTLRHILSRGWGITEPAVLLGFAVTVGWLVIFLMAAGLIFKYSR